MDTRVETRVKKARGYARGEISSIYRPKQKNCHPVISPLSGGALKSSVFEKKKTKNRFRLPNIKTKVVKRG